MRPHMETTPASGASRDDGEARVLLRKLRDLNLRASFRGGPGEGDVRIEGCLSVDRPVEHSVRYSVRVDGRALELDLRLRGGMLELVFEGEDGTELVTRHPLSHGAADRVGVEGIGELATHENRPEELERFLVALVRVASRRRAG